MKVTIRYCQDVDEKGNNFNFQFGDEWTLGIYLEVENGKTIAAIEWIRHSLKKELTNYTYNLNEAKLEDFINGIITNNLYNSTTFFSTHPKVFCNILYTPTGVFKFTFTQGNAKNLFYHVSNVNAKMFQECSLNLSNHLGACVDIDSKHFESMIEQKQINFVVRYDHIVADETNGVDVDIYYIYTKNKFVLKYKTSAQMFDIVSVTHTNKLEGYEKWCKVLESFVNRVKIIDKEEIVINNKRKTHNKIISVNEKVNPKPKVDNHGFTKPVINLLLTNMGIKPNTLININNIVGE